MCKTVGTEGTSDNVYSNNTPPKVRCYATQIDAPLDSLAVYYSALAIHGCCPLLRAEGYRRRRPPAPLLGLCYNLKSAHTCLFFMW
jgi:hypothetical protein